MNKNRIAIVFCLLLTAACGVANAGTVKVSSPDGNLVVSVGEKSGQAFYTVDYQGKRIVTDSRLGFQLSDGEVGSHVKIARKQRSAKDETWTQPWGEELLARNHYNELTVGFQEKTGSKRKMDVVFRVFDDGLGFRYVLAEGNGKGNIDKSFQVK